MAIDIVDLLCHNDSPMCCTNKFGINAHGMCDTAPMVDWQDLLHFAVLARTGSLSAAARELGVDHATVGRRVASLERSLDLKLIIRLPRSSRLTEDGQAIAGLAAEIEAGVNAIKRYAQGARVCAPATVKVSAPPAVAARLIAPHVAVFHELQPDITLILSGTPELVALDRGVADIAVRLSRPVQDGLVARRIGVMRFGLYAAPAVAARPAQDWTFIGYDAALDHLAQQAWLHGLLAGRRIVFQAGDLFGQHEAARAGLGAVVLPLFMGDTDPTLVKLPSPSPPPTRSLWLVTYPDLRRSSAVRAVMNFLADVVGQGCPLR
jgi:DNA-binding transcriptional LysR family regulator